MLKVGITGQSGFIGTYLFNFLKLKSGYLTIVPFEDSFFEEKRKFRLWAKECDVIVHLAALNRHEDQKFLHDKNIELIKRLITVLEETKSHPRILFSSSSQEIRDNEYGKSKREGRRLLSEWAKRNNAGFAGLIIPNVYGPFGRPYYNSVIATFCHQLTHSEDPHIDINGDLKLIYIGELAELIFRIIIEGNRGDEFQVRHTCEIKVSEILKILQRFSNVYLEKSFFPELKNRFEINLFNTFRSYIDNKSRFPFYLEKKEDMRGIFVELAKSEIGGQISFSSTNTGITRGNHFHTRKIERFAVIKGEALIQLRQIGTDEVLNFYLSGERPSFVDMPVWFTHNITNIGKEELLTVFWINEFFDESDSDTFFESV